MNKFIFIEDKKEYSFKFTKTDNDFFIYMVCSYENGFHGCERSLSIFRNYEDMSPYLSKMLMNILWQ
jgi:hypothetical protein